MTIPNLHDATLTRIEIILNAGSETLLRRFAIRAAWAIQRSLAAENFVNFTRPKMNLGAHLHSRSGDVPCPANGM